MSERLPFKTANELCVAFSSGTKFVLNYYGKLFEVKHMEQRHDSVYVSPPVMPVRVRPDGSSNESSDGCIWLEMVPPVADKGAAT